MTFLGFGFAKRVRAKAGFSVAPRDSLGEKPAFTRPLESKRSEARWADTWRGPGREGVSHQANTLVRHSGSDWEIPSRPGPL